MSPSADVVKRVDNLFVAAGSYNPYDLEDWLGALRNAADVRSNVSDQEALLREDLTYFSNNFNHRRWSQPRLSIPEQLDYTLLEQFKWMQPPQDGNYIDYNFQSQIPMTYALYRLFRSYSMGEEPGAMLFYPPQCQIPCTQAQAFYKTRLYSELCFAERGRRSAQAMKQNHYTLSNFGYSNFTERCFRIGSRTKSRRNYSFLCRFCVKNGEHAQMYTSHNLYYPQTSIVSCPVLRNYICKWCSATGDNAHTNSYCPWKPPTTRSVAIKGQHMEIRVNLT